eukprot:SAG11_NODE_1089_length_5920_cov_12.988146_5_plen_79_part_00
MHTVSTRATAPRNLKGARGCAVNPKSTSLMRFNALSRFYGQARPLRAGTTVPFFLNEPALFSMQLILLILNAVRAHLG